MQSEQQSIMDRLHGKSPDEWLAYLRPLEEGVSLGGLSMDVVFHYAAVQADKEDSLAWAEVATRAANLHARTSDGIESEDARVRSLRLRAKWIAKTGSRHAHIVLDKEVLLHEITQDLEISLDDARHQALHCKRQLAALSTLSTEERHRLVEDLSQSRRLRNRLDAAQLLAEGGELPPDSALHAWLEIRALFP